MVRSVWVSAQLRRETDDGLSWLCWISPVTDPLTDAQRSRPTSSERTHLAAFRAVVT